MVGWSRRAREDSERRARYRKWFNSLTPEEQERIRKEEAERWRRDKPKIIFMCILGFILMFVVWPLMAIKMGQDRAEWQWQHGKVVDGPPGQVCKEVEYCAPCAPIHHWHTRVECR